MNEIRAITVFSGSSFGNEESYREGAIALGKAIGDRGIRLVYGGGAKGLMGAVSKSAAEKTEVIGILPDGMNVPSVVEKMTYGRLIIVKDIHERKKMMYDLADAFIALPGGIGTLEELAEIYTWRQLEYHKKNIGLLNINGFWNPIISWLDKATEDGFISKKARDILIVEDDIEKLLDRLMKENKEVDHKL